MNPTAKTKMLSIFPGAPDWLRYSEKQRLHFVELQISLYLFGGITDAISLALEEFGYENANTYWRDRLSEPMRAKDFINCLVLHLHSGRDRSPGPVRMYEQAFDLAQDMGENWFFDGPRRQSLMVKPIEAAKWLLSLPLQRHLIPPTLDAFLSGKEPDRAASQRLTAEHQARKLGRPPEIIKQKIAAMRAALKEEALSRTKLQEMSGKELINYFGSSRYTLTKARDIVLSENVEKLDSDKSSTNDK